LAYTIKAIKAHEPARRQAIPVIMTAGFDTTATGASAALGAACDA